MKRFSDNNVNVEQQNNKFCNNLNLDISALDNQLLDNFKDKFDSSEIYYKPLINGDTPDILILEENKGVILSYE